MYQFLHFVLPAAAVLTTALQDVARDPSRDFPPSINKALLVRNIAVLVSHLESPSAYDETEPADQASCIQASKIISRRLNQILEGVFAAPATTIPTPNVASGSEGLESSSAASAAQGSTTSTFAPNDIGVVDLGGFDLLDLGNWATSSVLDLEVTNHDWNMF